MAFGHWTDRSKLFRPYGWQYSGPGEGLGSPTSPKSGGNKGKKGGDFTGGKGWGKGGKSTGGSGGGSSPSIMEVTRIETPSGTGTVDATIEGFGTPVAAMVMSVGGNELGTIVNNHMHSTGATDGTRQWCHQSNSKDHGLSRSTTGSIGNTISVWNMQDETTDYGSMSFNSWITDGVRFDYTENNAAAASKEIIVMLFRNVDAHCDVGIFDGSGNETCTPGFEANAILFGFTQRDQSNLWTKVNGSHVTHGWAAWDGSTITQSSSFQWNSDGFLNKQNQGQVWNSRAFVLSFGSAPSVSAVGATTFNLVNGATDFNFGYLALGGCQAHAEVVNAPTTTGLASIGSASFTPSVALIGVTHFNSVNTLLDTGAGMGHSIITADASYCNAIHDERTAGNNNIGRLTVDSAINVFQQDRSAGFEGVFSAFEEGGVELNMTAVTGSASKWPVLFLAAAA